MKAHRKVERTNVLGQAADRDAVDAGFGDAAHRFEADVARGFEDCPTGGECDRLAHLRQAHVVEQDHAGAGVERLAKFVGIFDLDLDELAGAGGKSRDALGLGDGGGDAAGRQDVVFLDQNGVIEAESVVAAAAAKYGEFLRAAQAGQRLAGIDDLRARAGDGVGELAGLGRHAGEQLQEVEGGALAGQERPGRAFDFAEQLVGGDALAVGGVPVYADRRIERLKTGVEPGAAAENGVFARDDGGLGPL